MQEGTDGEYPRLAVIENVPGFLNSNAGADFAVALSGLVGCEVAVPPGGWGTCGVVFGPLGQAAWRVIDAQYFGVAQRRRRVFVIYDPRGERAGEILVERASLRGDSPPRRTTGQGVAGTPGGGAGISGWQCNGTNVNDIGTLRSGNGHVTGGVPFVAGTLGGGAGERGCAPGTDRMTFVPIQNATRGKDQNGLGVGDNGDPMYTLDQALACSVASTLHASYYKGPGFNGQDDNLVAHTLRADGFDASEDGTGRGTPLMPIAFAMRGRDEGNVPEVSGDVSPAIRGASGGSTHTHVAMGFYHTNRQPEFGNYQDVSPTLKVGSNGGGNPTAVVQQMAVRRLTPRECERLQGFPDDFTLVGTMADGPRYRMLGNAVAVPVVEWLGRRIVAALGEDGAA